MNAKSSRGFTLLEVLVALTVLAFALGAVIKVAAESANNVAYLRDKTIAGWVAQNEINKILINRDWPEIGTTKEVTEMAGREWRWEIKVSETQDEDLRRVDITVLGGDDDIPVIGLTTFKGRFQ